MAGIRQSWAVGGSIVLAAATASIAVAEDTPFAERDSAFSGQPVLATPLESVSEPMAAACGSTTPLQFPRSYSSQCQPGQPGQFGRFKQRCQAKYWGYPEEFCEPPLGAMISGHYMAQVANGQAARMALYQYDFLPASDQLNTRGKAQVARIATWLQTNTFPVFVEPTPASPELDDLRRRSVWHELSGSHSSIPFEGVIIGRPNVRGIDADDALLLDRNRLGLTSSRGVSAGGGETSTSSTSAGGTTGTTERNN